jgi:hypothetical protein
VSLHQPLKLVVAEWLYAPKMLSRDKRQELVAHKPKSKPAKRRARKARVSPQSSAGNHPAD